MVLNRKQRRHLAAVQRQSGRLIEVNVARPKEELNKEYSKLCAELGDVIVRMEQINKHAQAQIQELQSKVAAKIESINELNKENQGREKDEAVKPQA